jgi:hypothetical protein
MIQSREFLISNLSMFAAFARVLALRFIETTL